MIEKSESLQEKVDKLEQVVAECRRKNENLLVENKKYKCLLDNMGNVVYTTDSNGVVTYVNAVVERIGGYKPSEVVGRPFTDFVYEHDRRERLQKFFNALSGKEEKTEYRYVTKSGDIKWVLTTGYVSISDNGVVAGVQGTLTDITHLKTIQNELEKSKKQYAELSITDALTGLYNARHFTNRLQYEVARCSRYRHNLSLLMMDIDGFKNYNDQYGHLEGNRVLERLGGLIAGSMRVADTAYRYGGDEFTAIVPEATGEQAALVARRILNAVNKEVFLLQSGDGVCVSMSIGVAQFVLEETIDEFIKRADANMYEAKRAGGGNISFRHCSAVA